MSLSNDLAERLREKGLVPNVEGEAEGESRIDAKSESGSVGDPEELDAEGELGTDEEGEVAEGESEDSGDVVSDGDETPLELLTDLAGYLDTEPDRLYALKVKMPDGETTYSVGELKDLAQNRAAAEQELAEQRQQFEAERDQVRYTWQQQSQQQAALNEEGSKAWQDMQLAKAEYERIDWAELEKIDPGRAALESQKLIQKFASAKNALEQAQGQINQERHQYAQQAKQYHDSELLKRVPEWRDPQKAMADTTSIVEWMRSEYKFNDQEIQGAVDWRFRDILRKAHSYDRMKSSASQAGKPPIVISGRRRRNSQTADEQRYQQTIANAKKPGTSQEAKLAAAKVALERAFANKR